jgi:hypothetical protein
MSINDSKRASTRFIMRRDLGRVEAAGARLLASRSVFRGVQTWGSTDPAALASQSIAYHLFSPCWTSCMPSTRMAKPGFSMNAGRRRA